MFNKLNVYNMKLISILSYGKSLLKENDSLLIINKFKIIFSDVKV